MSQQSELHDLLTKLKLSPATLEKPCSDDLFLTLMKEIPSFEEAAPYFLSTQAKMEELRNDFHSERSRKLHMLWYWKRKNGSDATYLAIVKIFLQMEDKFLAELVLKGSYEIKSMSIDSRVNPERVPRYRNWEALSEKEKEQIRNNLKIENENIRMKFSSLFDQILCSFDKRNIRVVRFKIFLGNVGVLSSHLECASTLDDVMFILHKFYTSWFNIKLFKHCVVNLGSDDDQGKMNEYETEYLVPYLQRSIFEIPSKSFVSNHDNKDFVPLFLFLPNDIIPTGEDVVIIRSNLSKMLGLPDGILQFISYNVGSIILLFGAPQALLQVDVLHSVFTFNPLKKTYNFRSDLLSQILPPGIRTNEFPFHKSSITSQKVLYGQSQGMSLSKPSRVPLSPPLAKEMHSSSPRRSPLPLSQTESSISHFYECADAFRNGDYERSLELLTAARDHNNIIVLGFSPKKYMNIKYVRYDVSLLHLAAYHGWLEICHQLITEHKINPRVQGRFRSLSLHSTQSYLFNDSPPPPLFYATLSGHYEVVKYLINRCSCDPHQQSEEGETPLYLACLVGHYEIVHISLVNVIVIQIWGCWGLVIIHFMVPVKGVILT